MERTVTTIKIAETEDLPSGWRFSVELSDEAGQQMHAVELGSDFWQTFAMKYMTPQELVEKSFEFLLERELKESILRAFNLKDIARYFPEYEEILLRE